MDHTPYPTLYCTGLHCTVLYCTVLYSTVLLLEHYYAAMKCYAAPHWLHCWYNTSAAAIAEEKLWRTVLNLLLQSYLSQTF